jgi:nicotinamidase/pyrazinamidase
MGIKAKKALLIIDLQNDFCPGGALGIPGGDTIIPKLNKYLRFFSRKKRPIFVAGDWHPVRTSHFKDFGGTWPVHCLQNSRGAQFHPQLKLPQGTIILYKVMDPEKESDSVFQSEDHRGMSFAKLLQLLGISELYIGGLATDFCVKASVVDVLKQGLKVKLLLDGMKGVDIQAGDSEKALKEMLKKGAKKITVKALR